MLQRYITRELYPLIVEALAQLPTMAWHKGIDQPVRVRRCWSDQRWAAVLLLCGNLGLGGSWDGSRRLLARLAELLPATED